MNSADNLAFELDERPNEDIIFTEPPLTPIVRRTSTFYEQYDSVSMYTSSTVPSDVNAMYVSEYERMKANLENSESQKSSGVQYNIHLDNVVIVGGNEKKENIDINEPMTHVINEIISRQIPFKYQSIDDTKLSAIKKFLLKKKFSIPLIMILIGLLCGLSFILYYVLQPEKIDDKLSLVKRSAWDDESLPLSGKFKLISPVEKIILLKIQTDMCETEEDCITFMREQQQNAYPEYDDIRENFIIASDGTVYEGRGFEREGETTCEDDMITCYNSKAISIAFVQNITMEESEINDKQNTAFCIFIRETQKLRNISESFNVFYHDNLISSVTSDSNEYNKLNKCSKSYNVPQIEKKNNTLNRDVINNDLLREFSRKVLIKSTNGNFCDAKENCESAAREANQKANFIFNGDNLLIEDLNFDIAVNESHNDTLVILFVGNYGDLSQKPVQLNLLYKFLDYAIVLGKLVEKYKICVTSEAKQLLNEIQIRTPERVENFCN